MPRIRSSVGVGLIWDSPLGPLRFDLAYPLTKESYDRTQIFRFSGGTKFSIVAAVRIRIDLACDGSDRAA